MNLSMAIASWTICFRFVMNLGIFHGWFFYSYFVFFYIEQISFHLSQVQKLDFLLEDGKNIFSK